MLRIDAVQLHHSADRVVANALRGLVDGGLHLLTIGGFYLAVAVGGIGTRAEQVPLTYSKLDSLIGDGSQIFDRILARKPFLDNRGILSAHALGELDDELIAIAEVDPKSV